MNNVIKIKSSNGTTQIEINGERLELVKSFSVEQKAGEPLPLIIIECYADIETDFFEVLESNLIKKSR